MRANVEIIRQKNSTAHCGCFEMFLLVLCNLEWLPLLFFRSRYVVLAWTLIVKELCVKLLSVGYWHEQFQYLHDVVA